MRPTFAEINLKNLTGNFNNIKKKIGNSKIMAVVKADAYGHGMLQVSSALIENELYKPDYFGVALLEEAEELRKAKIKIPILVFAPILKEEALIFSKLNINGTVVSEEQLRFLKNYPNINIHIKIDTGMNRLGVKWQNAVDFIKKAVRYKNIKINGIFTHFASSDEKNKNFSLLQLKRFKSIIDQLHELQISFGLAHCANSGAILDMPDSYLDMVRPGISLYGYYPSLETMETIKLKPVMSLYSKITTVKEIQKNETVGYGRTYKSDKNLLIASIPFGYADGCLRAMSNKMKIIHKNNLYSQIGRVSMDRIMINMNNSGCKIGDKITILGKESTQQLDAWDWSKIMNTIPYEITCGISKRVPRKYTYK